MERRKTRQISIGPVKVGRGAPISVQSMTKTDTWDIRKTVYQIRRLEEAGCEIVRVAVVDQEAARAITEIKKKIRIPLIADIHFHPQLALLAVESGADGLRINPGNIGGRDRLKPVLMEAKNRSIPIRIAGSLRDAGSDWNKVAQVSFYMHRSQDLGNLKNLFSARVSAQVPRMEYVVVDGYSAEGKFCEVEVTATR